MLLKVSNLENSSVPWLTWFDAEAVRRRLSCHVLSCLTSQKPWPVQAFLVFDTTLAAKRWGLWKCAGSKSSAAESSVKSRHSLCRISRLWGSGLSFYITIGLARFLDSSNFQTSRNEYCEWVKGKEIMDQANVRSLGPFQVTSRSFKCICMSLSTFACCIHWLDSWDVVTRIFYFAYLRHAVSIAVYRGPSWPGFCLLVPSSSCVCFSTRFLGIKCWLDVFFLWSCFDLHNRATSQWVKSFEVLFQHLLVENMSAIPVCRGLIAVSLLPLAAWWAPNCSVHPCFQGNSNLSALVISRSRATLCKWPFLTERQAFRMAPGSYVYGVSSNSPLRCKPVRSSLAEKLSQTNAQYRGRASCLWHPDLLPVCRCPKHFVHWATTAITAQAP